jgi:hypothetical protein
MKQVYDQAKSQNPVNSTRGREEMFNEMVLCCVGAGLAIRIRETELERLGQVIRALTEGQEGLLPKGK